MGNAFAHIPATSALIGLAIAGLTGGLSRGFSGFGAALVFVPVASAAVGPQEAVPTLALMECVACLAFLPGAWRYGTRREAATMSAGAVLGVPIGAVILARSDPLTLRWALCALVLVAVAILGSGWRWGGQARPSMTAAVGAVGGVMSGTAMLGGVAPATYWLGARGTEARVVRANMNLYFAALTAFVTGAFAWQGLVTWRTAWLACAAGPAYGFGLWSGSRLFWIASDRVFRIIAYAMILGAALIGLPLWDGVLR